MTGDEALEDVGEILLGIDGVELAGLDQRGRDRPMPAAAVAAREERVFLVRAGGLMARSTVLESISTRPSPRKRQRPCQCSSA